MIPDLLREYQDIGLIKIRTSLGQTNVLFDLAKCGIRLNELGRTAIHDLSTENKGYSGNRIGYEWLNLKFRKQAKEEILEKLAAIIRKPENQERAT